MSSQRQSHTLCTSLSLEEWKDALRAHVEEVEAFSIVAKSSENEKRMCVNICLQCPNNLKCAAHSKRYYTKVMEMGTGDACADVCDKNIPLANVQKRRRLLQSGDEGC